MFGKALTLPFASPNLHINEVEPIATHRFNLSEARFRKRASRPVVPFQCVKVNAGDGGGGKNVIEQGVHGVGAIAFAPILAVSYHNAQLGFALPQVDIIVHAVADVLAVQCVDSQVGLPMSNPRSQLCLRRKLKEHSGNWVQEDV